MNDQVDLFIEKLPQWKTEIILLRALLQDCLLVEEFKWKQPCYTFQNSNVVMLQNFKDYCALGFFKGALLSNSEGLLVKPGENSNSSRMIKFFSTDEILKQKKEIKAIVFEAIEIEKAGLRVENKPVSEFEIPKELETTFLENIDFKNAFNKLTPGRQKGYLLHFSSAKQSATRVSRIQNYMPKILKGKGINDCTCGLSKRMPVCDGSHKVLKA